MKAVHLFIIIAIALVLVGCPLDNERPPREINPVQLPELPESVIQIPLALKSRLLKRAFYQEFPNPLLRGETPEYKMKLSGKEKKDEERNFIGRMTKPLLNWVDKTFYVSSKVFYEVDLYSFDFWFEGQKFYADIIMDIRSEVQLKNAIHLFGENAKIDGDLKCPMQVRMVLEGEVEMTPDVNLIVKIDEESAKIKFQKLCSSKAIKAVDMPKLLRPVLEPLKVKISKTVNKLIARQLQKMISSNHNLSFRSQIDAAAQQLGQPYELVDGIWLEPNVQEIFVSPINGTGKGFANQLEISIGAKAKPLVKMSEKKPKVTLPKKVNFAVENYPSGTNIYVHGKVALDYAAKELQLFLKDYVDENHSKQGYTIGATHIFPSEKKVVVAIDVLKVKTLKKKATLYLWGLPKYDAEQQEIYLDELAFTAKSKNILLKFAQWMMHPKIMKQLEANTRFALSDKLQELQGQLNHFKIEQETGTLTGKFHYVDVSEVFVTEKDFEVFLQAKGDLDYDIKW